jgi:uncharacterized membrane protein
MGESSPARLRGIDAARGLALLGMLAVHLLPSRDDDGAISLSYRLASGRAAATFAVLAGVGLALAAALLVPPASHLLREHLAVAPPTNPTFGTLVQDPAGCCWSSP